MSHLKRKFSLRSPSLITEKRLGASSLCSHSSWCLNLGNTHYTDCNCVNWAFLMVLVVVVVIVEVLPTGL